MARGPGASCTPGRRAGMAAAAIAGAAGRGDATCQLHKIRSFQSVALAEWARQHLCEGSRVLCDGLACFNAVTDKECSHDPVVTGGGRASAQHPEFHWVSTILGNVKSALRSTYHSFRPKYAQRYLSEFEYRFNRRFHLPELIPRLAYVALRTPRCRKSYSN